MLIIQGRGAIRNLVVGDLNLDTKNDIICSSDEGNKIVWLLNMTPDTRGADILFESSFTALDLPGGSDVSEVPWGIDLGDIDGDTKVDVLLSTAGGPGPYVLHNMTPDNTTLGRQVSFVVYDLDRQRSRNVRVVDLNLDGKPDLAIANAYRVNDAANNKIFVIPNTHCMKPEMMPTDGTVCDGADFFLEATPGLGVEYKWTADGGGSILTSPDNGARINLTDWLTISGDAYVITVEAVIGGM